MRSSMPPVGEPFFSADSNDIAVSFEFFPPHSPAMEVRLWRSIQQLQPLRPRFVSVTYGAGGSTRQRTHATVARLKHDTNMEPAAHLTCVGASREEVDAIAQRYYDLGVHHIVALRGDPVGNRAHQPRTGEYAYAADLVAGLRKVGDFEISVAAYPEGHPESPDKPYDLDNLKRKVDSGASRAISQFFFDPDIYLRFAQAAQDAGIKVPLVPGILPVTNCARALQFAERCGIAVPDWITTMFEGMDDRPETRHLVAATIAAHQCRVLYEQGVREFHFYTLNRAELVYAICHILGVRPVGATAPS